MKEIVMLCACVNECGREVLRLHMDETSHLHEYMKAMRPVVAGHTPKPKGLIPPSVIGMQRRAFVFRNAMELMGFVRKTVGTHIGLGI